MNEFESDSFGAVIDKGMPSISFFDLLAFHVGQ